MAREPISIEHLPQEAQDKLLNLRAKRDESLAIVRDLTKRRIDAAERLQFWQLRIAELRKPQSQLIESISRDGQVLGQQSTVLRAGLPDDAPQMRDALREAALLEKELARLDASYQTHEARWTDASQLLGNIESHVRRLNGSTALFTGEIATAYKGNIADAVEGKRRKLRELAADKRAAEDAPILSSAGKANVRVWLDELTSRGAPDLLALIEGAPASSIRFAEAQSVQQFHGAAQLPTGTAPVLVAASVRTTDVLALLCWLDRPKIEKRLMSEIDSLSDDEHALSDKQRADRLAEIERDVLAVQREEVALIELAAEQGLTIPHRADVDPVAYLGLAQTDTHQ